MKRRSFYGRLNEDRTAGQQELHNLAAKKHLNEVDWPTVIQKADELHRQEQRRLRKKEKRWRRRQLRRSKYIRKKYGESAGVYCVNLLTFNTHHDQERFLEDEFDDSYSIYYTTESITTEYITDATESLTIECGIAEDASRMEYATEESAATLDYTTDSSTLDDDTISFSERFHKIATCQPKTCSSGNAQLEAKEREQEGSLTETETVDMFHNDMAMHAPHGRLSTLTEEPSSESDSAIPPTGFWM